MEMFNRRKDVEYYEIGVFDEEWKPVPFVTSYKILKLNYLSHVKFDVYMNAKHARLKLNTYVLHLNSEEIML